MSKSKEIKDEAKEKTPWWVIVLKICAYALGLILAGYGTTAAATSMSHLFTTFNS